MTVSQEVKIGKVVNYYSRISVAAVEVTGGCLKKGDTVRFMGANTDFTQMVESMEIEKKPVEKAEKGESVGIKVKDRVRPNDLVFKVS